MSSSSIRRITVRFISPTGEDLGTALARPTGGNWRVLGNGAPRIRIGSRTAPCQKRGEEWVFHLLDGESKPRNKPEPTAEAA